MTKSSDRYARWFGTRVPLVSRGGIALLTFFGALPFSVVLYIGFYQTIFTINFWIALLLTILVGALFHILIMSFLKIRFNNPSHNPDFNSLVSRIHQKVVISPRTHIWVRQSSDVFIASTFNPIYDAIIISEPMVDLIMRSPESGEVLLAYHLYRVPRTRWFGDLVGSVILFTMLTFASSLFLVPFVFMIGQSIMIGNWYIFYSLGPLASLFMAPILLIFLVKGTFWRHDAAFDGVQEIYGMHPNVAKVQVERGTVLNEEEAQTVVWAVRDWEKRKRGGRRAGVSTIVAILSFLFGLLSFAIIGYLPYTIMMYLVLLPYILAFVSALVAYLVLGRRDKNAIGEVFKKTTDYDEPIWVD